MHIPPSLPDDVGVRFGRTRIISTSNPLFGFYADGIATPANRRGLMGVGVAGAIRLRGGSEVEREVMAQAPLTMGTAVSTNPGELSDLGVKVIIHAVVADALGGRIREQHVRMATMATLEQANASRVKILALPLLGTGGIATGLGFERAALTMIEEIVAQLRRFTSRLDCIVLMCNDDREQRFLERTLEEARRSWWGLRV